VARPQFQQLSSMQRN